MLGGRERGKEGIKNVHIISHIVIFNLRDVYSFKKGSYIGTRGKYI